MSRSASNMNDLVRQELSDYVDKKSQNLPSITATPSVKKKTPILKKALSQPSFARHNRVNRSSFSSDTAVVKPESQFNHQTMTGVEQTADDVRQIHVINNNINSSSVIDQPSPPLVPKPPSNQRVSKLRRHKYISV